jgi:hypothetical protein
MWHRDRQQSCRARVSVWLVSRFRSSPQLAAGIGSELRNHKGH